MRIPQVTLLTLVLLSLSTPWTSVLAADPGAAGLVSSISREGGEGLSPCATGCGGQIVPAADAAYEQQVIERVNAERAARGAPPLKLAAGLRDAARYHATDMAQDDYFEHDSYDRAGGRLERVCSTWERIATYYTSAWGENIAAGYSTPESVMSGWMNSPGHRDNLLNPHHREIGVGYYRGGSWRHYWVQDFGSREGVYPLIIDREASSTDSIHVSLYQHGDGDQIRLRNDDGDWSSWRPFANQIDWTLPARAGQHTVWAEVRDGGQTASSSDTILLRAAPALGSVPDQVRFVYSMRERRLLSDHAWVTPENVGNDDPFTWQVTITGRGFECTPLSGRAGEAFRIVPSDFDRLLPGTVRGLATVMVSDPDGMPGAPQQIDLAIEVVDAPFDVVYLPVMAKR